MVGNAVFQQEWQANEEADYAQAVEALRPLQCQEIGRPCSQ